MSTAVGQPPLAHVGPLRRVGARAALAPASLGWMVVGVVAIIVCLRWMLRSQYLFDLDSILFARALDDFDLRMVQPALPGYISYVELGRLVRLFLVDANLSLEFLSAAFGALLPVALFALGRELFDKPTAVLAALLGATGPVFWYQSSVASPRIAEGVLATVVVLLGARYRSRGDARWFWMLTVAVGLAGGFRQQVLLYLLPFCIWATWRAPLRQRMVGTLLGGLIVLSWLVPTVLAAGGVDEYRRLSNEQWQTFIVNQTGVLYATTIRDAAARFVENAGRIALYAFFTCPLGIVAAGLLWRRGKHSTTGRSARPAYALLMATVPAVLFFAFIHIQQIGHIMAVAPFIVLVIARFITSRVDKRSSVVVGGCVVAINLLFVFFVPSRLIGDRLGTPSVAAIHERDDFIASGIAAIKAGSPANTLVITSPLTYGFIEQYAHEYQYLLLPGLFEQGPDDAASLDQRALTNGMQPLPAVQLPSPGLVLADRTIERVVLFGYDKDITQMLTSSSTVQRPDPAIPSLSLVEAVQPVAVKYGPGRLDLVPTDSVTGST